MRRFMIFKVTFVYPAKQETLVNILELSKEAEKTTLNNFTCYVYKYKKSKVQTFNI